MITIPHPVPVWLKGGFEKEACNRAEWGHSKDRDAIVRAYWFIK
jgi:hypothetical protein